MKDIKTKLSIVYNELWPHIAKSEKPSCKGKVLEDSVCSSSDLDFLLSEAKDSFKIEEDRMKQVEQKANISIGITGVIATIIASLFPVLLEKLIKSLAWYRCSTLMVPCATLSRYRSYHSLGTGTTEVI